VDSPQLDGFAAVSGARLTQAVDNNLTQRLSIHDPGFRSCE
jgi:hypothetical protein